jgi:hypothetical protein
MPWVAQQHDEMADSAIGLKQVLIAQKTGTGLQPTARLAWRWCGYGLSTRLGTVFVGNVDGL